MTREETIKWLESLKAEIGKSEYRALWHYAEAIDMAIEALKDRSTGEWKKATESIWKCSLCNAIMFTDSNYCPNCGAKMNGERSGNE